VAKCTAEINKKTTEDKEKRKERDGLRQSLMETNNTITELNNTKKSALNVYHPKMGAIIAEIGSRRSQFREMPIGPLGTHVKIEKEEWVHICENLFGKNLNGFLVTSHEDRKLLHDILERHKWYFYPLLSLFLTESDVPIIIAKKDLFDYGSGEPDPKYDTVLRILKVPLI
jgi:structural maintenance of chromosomes protein 6